MTKQRIQIGIENSGTGDTLRAAMIKINNNFDELYDLQGQDSTGKAIDINGNTISSTFTNTDITISPNGTGNVVIDGDLVANIIKSDDSTGIVIDDNLILTGVIKADSSSLVRIAEDVNIDGTVTATAFVGDGSGLTGISGGGGGGGDSTETYTNILRSNDSTAIQVADNLIPTQDDTFSLGTADKKWSAVHVAGGTIFLGNLQIKDSGSNSLQVLQSDGTTSAALESTSTILNVVGDDSTDMEITLGTDRLFFQGGTNIETSTDSGAQLTISTSNTPTFSGTVTAGGFTIGSAAINEAELETIDGVTAGTVTASKAVVVDSNKDIGSFRNVTATGSFIIGSADMNETDLEKLDGITNGTAAANKAIVADANIDVTAIRNLTLTGNIQVGGDMTVSGTTTSVNTTNLEIQDALLELSKNNSGGSDVDAGLLITRGSAGNNAAFYWNEGDDKFKAVLTTSAADASAVTDSSTATIVANLEGNVTGNVTGNTSGSSGSTTGNAATATALETARTIGGVSFDGTGNINLPGVNTAGNQNTSGTAAVATTVTVTDNESTNEENVVTFVAGADSDGGNVGLESDGNFTYNPSTGAVTATKFKGDGSELTGISGGGGSSTLNVIGDDSTDMEIALGTDRLFFQGGTNVTTSTDSGAQLTISVDDTPTFSGAVTAAGFTIGSAAINESELETIDGVTAGTVAASKAVVVDSNKDIGSFRNVTATGSFIIGSADMNETDLEKLDGITNGTVAASKAVVVDSNKDAGTFRNITASGTVQFGSLSDGTITVTAFVDEDNMSSNSATLIPTQQSVKAYVDTEISGVSGGSNTLNVIGDDSTDMEIALGTDRLFFQGGTNVSTSTDSGAQLTISVADAPTFSGAVTAAGFTIGSAAINESELETIDGVTAGTVAASKAVVVDSNKDIGDFRNVTASGSFIIGSADMNETDLEKLDGITNGTVAANKAVVVDGNKDAGSFRNITATGTITTATLDVNSIESTDSSNVRVNEGLDVVGGLFVSEINGIDSSAIEVNEVTNFNGNVVVKADVTATGSFIIGSASMNETDLEKLDGITNGTAAANKAVVLDGSKDIGTLGAVTATSFVIGSADINETDLEKIDGITNGTVAANKAVVVDGDKDAGNFRNLTGVTLKGTTSLQTPLIEFTDGDNAITIADGGGITANTSLTLASGATVTAILDEDNFASDSDTALATQQSIKAYVGSQTGSSISFRIAGSSDSTQASIDLSSNEEFRLVGGNSITTTLANTSVNTMTVALDDNIAVDEISAKDSSNIQIKSPIAADSTISSGAITSSGVVTATGFTIGSAVINETELETIDGITAGTVAASKAVVVDSNKDIGDFRNVTASTLTADGGVSIDNITIDGTEIDLSSGDLTIDVAGDIILDAGGDEVIFKDGSTNVGHVSLDSDNLTIKSLVSDKDIILQGNDGGSGITALTLDMSAAGAATFNDTVTATGFIIGSANINEAELETIDGITAGTVAASKAVVVDSNKDIASFRNVTATGTVKTAILDVNSILSTDSSNIRINEGLDVVGGLFVSEINAIDSSAIEVNEVTNFNANVVVKADVTATGSFIIGSASMNEADLEKLDGITNGTVAANKAVVVDGNKDAGSFRNITATGATTSGTFVIGSADINEADLEQIDGLTAGTVAASKAVVVDSNKDIGDFRNFTASGNGEFGGNLQVGGNLTVSGTTTSVNTTNLEIQDALLELNKNNSGGADVDAGIFVQRGSAGNNAVLYWNEGDDSFKAVLSNSAADATSVTDSSFAALEVGSLTVNAGVGITASSGDVTVANATSNKDLIFTVNDGGSATEVFRLDGDVSALLVASGKELRFADSGEKISGDGTDLTIASGAKINLTATSDVVIPADVGITFGTGEKIEGDNTDLTITSGAKINLTATSDIHIPNDVGIVFGGDSEKIEGDGTDLVISANNLTVDAAADIILDAGGNDFNFKAGGTEILRITNSSSDVIIRPVVDAKDLIFQQRDGTEVARVEDNGTFNVVTGKLAINGTAITSTAAELNLLDGITAGTVAASKAVIVDSNKDADGFRNVTATGTVKTAILDVNSILSTDSSNIRINEGLDVVGGLFVSEINAIDSTAIEVNEVTNFNANVIVKADVTATGSFIIGSASMNEADLEKIDGVTAGTVAASKAVVVDSNKDAGSFRNITATGATTSGTFVIGSADINEADLEQIDGLTAGTVAASKAVVVDSNKDIGSFRNVTATGAITSGTFVIGDADINEADLEQIDGLTAGTVTANKAVVVDGDKDISAFRNVTATKFIIGSADIDETDLEKIDGITNGAGAANKALVLDGSADVASGLRNLTASGTVKTAILDVNNILSTDSSNIRINEGLDVVGGLFVSEINAIDSSAIEVNEVTNFNANVIVKADVTATGSFIIGSASMNETDLEKLDGITNGTVAAGKAVVVDSNKDAGDFRNLTASTLTADGGVSVDNITIDGTEIDLSSGDLTLDVAGDIVLDAGGNDVKVSSGGTHVGTFTNSSSDFVITAAVQDKDVIIKGDDNGSAITALTLDMSEAGAATFNSTVTATGFIIGSADINEADLEQIDGLTAGTVAASKAVVVDSNKDAGDFRNVTLSGTLHTTTLDVREILSTDSTNITVNEGLEVLGTIQVNEITSSDSSEVTINNIRTQVITANDSTEVLINDALRVSGLITGTATAAQYSDLAERYEADAPMEKGDVVEIGGSKEITKVDEEVSDTIFGVVSSVDQAGFTMNAEAGNDATHPLVALTGRVVVKVEGPVSKGDRLVTSSTAGVARQALKSECNAFTVVGRALEDKNTDGIGLVLCYVQSHA